MRSDDLRLYIPEALKNVTLPGEMILTGTGLGAAYEKVSSYKLSEGQTAELFRRTRPVTTTEVKQFIDELSRAYGKDYSQQYRRKIDIPLALRTDIFGDVYGTIYPVGPRRTFHPSRIEHCDIDHDPHRPVDQRPAIFPRPFDLEAVAPDLPSR